MLTPAQLKAHWSGIGGSMAPNVCGLGRLTPYEAWLRYVYPETRTTEETEAMEFGNEAEDMIARVAARRWGVKVRRRNVTLAHRTLPFMIANIDRDVVGVPWIMECKNRGFFMGRRYGDDLSEDVQPDEMIQAQHYLAVTEKAKCLLAVLIGGQMLRRFEILRDDDAIGKIIRIESHFWNLVQTKTPPPPSTHQDCADLWPEHKLALREITEDQARLVDRVRDLRLEAKLIGEELDGAEVKLKMMIGENEGLILPGAERPIVTWKLNTAGARVLRVMKLAA